MRLGEITQEPIEAYHANDCVGHSRLETFRDPDRGPARYYGQYIAKTIPGFSGSTATDVGAAVDALVLEKRTTFEVLPTTYGPEGKKFTMASNECKAIVARIQSKGLIPLKADDAASVLAMRDAVMANPIAAALLGRGLPQLSFRYDFGPFRVQVRPDWWNSEGVTLPSGFTIPNYIVDLKTAEDEGQFHANRRNFGYDRQAALYSEVVRMVLADAGGIPLEEVAPIPFFFAVVYKTPPIECVVTVLEKHDLEDATEQVFDDIRRLKAAYKENKWPGVPSGIVTMPSLNWKRRNHPEFVPEPAFTVAA